MSQCYKCLILLVQENKIKNRNLCKKCSRQICKDYKAKNKDLISEYNKKYRQENNKCFKWTNLQPLEGKINMSKKNKICQSEVINHYDKVKKFATLKNIDLNIFDYSKYF
jgi:PHP family Zn ribbon phosphoesterase